MFTLVKFDGTVISEHLSRDAAYLAMQDAMEQRIPCHIEATFGQPTELVKACRQKAAQKAYAFDVLRGQRQEIKPMKITRGNNSYVVPVEMLKNDGSGLKKSAIKAINAYFNSLAVQTV